ncbi:hypothetical protein ACIQD3_20310 [Peribacillus loiseleuriae]
MANRIKEVQNTPTSSSVHIHWGDCTQKHWGKERLGNEQRVVNLTYR